MTRSEHLKGTEAAGLIRRAAELGPGFRGRRREVPPEEREALAAQLESAGLAAPSYLRQPVEWIDRAAKLFEAGEYPDKGLTLAESDLDAWVEAFQEPVPVLVEHAESPLALGYLTQVERQGRELHGTLALSAEADALIRRSGADRLSIGLDAAAKRIREVSLVRHPRVADARLFRGSLLADPEPESVPDPVAAPKEPRFDAERRIEDLLREGRVTPAQVPYLRALLGITDAVDFGGDRRPLRHLVIAMVERQLPHGLFGETVPIPAQEAAEHLLLPEEAAFYRRHFPDVSLGEIAARRTAGR